jgi:hypothetical protein
LTQALERIKAVLSRGDLAGRLAATLNNLLKEARFRPAFLRFTQGRFFIGQILAD